MDVVISNYNYAQFLGAAIESALRQTHPLVNVIAVDDGSTDGSRELLRSYQGRVDILLKENGGQASALNAGIARCRGDVVLFLDADDILRPHAASVIAQAFATDLRLSKVQFGMAVIDRFGNPTGMTQPTTHLHPPVGDMRRAELAFPFDLPWTPGGATGFRTEMLRRILPIPERAYPRWGADWYLVHLTALLGSAAWLNEICADYRVHGKNGYRLQYPELDLEYIRDTVRYAEATTGALTQFADRIGLDRPDRILSWSDLGNRLISVKLEPELHPISSDQPFKLLAEAFRAARRRFDRRLPAKLLMLTWFIAMVISPRRIARRLGLAFHHPEHRRPAINRFLSRLYEAASDPGPALR